MCLYQITWQFTGRDTCVTDIRYDSGNGVVGIGGKNCNGRHEKLEVIDIDKLNAEIRKTVANIDHLRAEIDKIVAEIEG